MIDTVNEFLFNDFPWSEELSAVIEKSSTRVEPRLKFKKPYTNFNLAEIVIYLMTNGKDAIIPLCGGVKPLNNLWKFLECCVFAQSSLLYSILYKGQETILYFEPKPKNFIRFVVMDNETALLKEKKGEIFKHKYLDFEVKLDVALKKKQFITQFYNFLTKIFKNYENVAYFEPPLTGFDLWTKDSLIICEYLKKPKLKQVGAS